MKILRQGVDLDIFFEKLGRSRKRGLLIDYDGTLAPFKKDYRNALPYPGVKESLERITKGGHTHLSIVTGRQASDIIRFLNMENPPEIWGSHGYERIRDGITETYDIDLNANTILKRVRLWVSEQGWDSIAEEKYGSLAIHWRGLSLSEVEEIKKRCLSLTRITSGTSAKTREFDGGLEVLAKGRNKGDAVNTVFNELGRETVAAYLGDDKTDEDAFNAIGDRGLSILIRGELRKTAADVWMIPPIELLDFLYRWNAVCTIERDKR